MHCGARGIYIIANLQGKYVEFSKGKYMDFRSKNIDKSHPDKDTVPYPGGLIYSDMIDVGSYSRL